MQEQSGASMLLRPRQRAGGDPVPNVPSHYDRLMSVSFRHDYYNRSDDACTDLSVRPTAFSQRLMHSIGLLFRDEGTGFSILYDTNRADALIAYLGRNGETRDGIVEFWTRLSFVLTTRSSYFISVTDIPIDLNPIAANFYFTNQAAHVTPDGEILLNPGAHVSGDELLPVIPSQYPVPVPDDVLGVAVRAISGEVVLCEPRCKPDPPPPRPPGMPCSDWLREPQLTMSKRCRDTIYLDFSALPEDKYDIEYVTDGAARPVGECLYVSETPAPLCFIDLLFSAPTVQSEGFYPVKGLAAGAPATIVPIDYVLNFKARATVWNYFIVPQLERDRFDHLHIHSTPPSPPVHFAGPCCVVLPNGKKAYRFLSRQPLHLRQQSPYRLRLSGQRGDRSADNEVLIDRLPVAGNQVIPRTDAMTRADLARTLCPDAEDSLRCQGLIHQLFGDPDVSTETAVARMRGLRRAARPAAAARAVERGATAPNNQSFSEIYVYV